MPTPKLNEPAQVIATPDCQRRLINFEIELKWLCEKHDLSLRPNTRAEERGIYIIDRLDARPLELQYQWPYVASFTEVNRDGVQDFELDDYGTQPPKGSKYLEQIMSEQTTTEQPGEPREIDITPNFANLEGTIHPPLTDTKNHINILQIREIGDDEDDLQITVWPAGPHPDTAVTWAEENGIDAFSNETADDYNTVVNENRDIVDGQILTAADGRSFRINITEILGD